MYMSIGYHTIIIHVYSFFLPFFPSVSWYVRARVVTRKNITPRLPICCQTICYNVTQPLHQCAGREIIGIQGRIEILNRRFNHYQTAVDDVKVVTRVQLAMICKTPRTNTLMWVATILPSSSCTAHLPHKKKKTEIAHSETNEKNYNYRFSGSMVRTTGKRCPRSRDSRRGLTAG